jgi:uncharacterized cofD-like protein
VALAEEEDLLASLFQHRFRASDELNGHSVGNLILAALAEQTGCFIRAVEVSSRVLRTVGRILPSTADDVRLEAILTDGGSVVGETAVARVGRPIERIVLRPREPVPGPGVVEALGAADLIVLGPGSLFTSLLPIVAVPAISEVLRATRAPIMLVGNLVSEPDEVDCLELHDHVRIIERHVGSPVISAVLAHDGEVPSDVLQRYLAEGSSPLRWRDDGAREGLTVLLRRLIGPGPKLRHDPHATALGLLDAWRAVRDGARAGSARSSNDAVSVARSRPRSGA